MDKLKKLVLKELGELKKLGACSAKSLSYVKSGKFDASLQDHIDSGSRVRDVVDHAIMRS